MSALPVNPSDMTVHLLWINAGLSCDGDSVSLTAATLPSVEDIVMGAIPGLPKVVRALAARGLPSRRRLHAVVLEGGCGRARSVRPGGRRIDSERRHQRRRLLGWLRQSTRRDRAVSPISR